MPELIHEIPPSESQPPAWLVIDSTITGRSHGGLRIAPDTNLEELRMLARRMTLKFGFLGIANGGAKAGIRANPEAPAHVRRAMLRRFAESIHEQADRNRYSPHPDMGTTVLEIREAFRLDSTSRQTDRQESGYYTALGVLAAANVLLRMRGKEWNGLTIAVHGFGKVGSSFAQLASQRGATIVAVSTSHGALYDHRGLSVADLMQASAAAGSRFVQDFPAGQRLPNEELLQLPVDLLSPCAGSGSIHEGNSPGVKAEMICGGANCPVTLEARQQLESRRIACLPDFLTSAGGILGGTMAFAGLDEDAIRKLVPEYLERRFATLFEKTWDVTEQECMQRFLEMKENAQRKGFRGRLFDFGLELYRHGMIPRFLVSRLAPRYFLSR